MAIESKKTADYLKNIKQAAEEVANWPKEKLENAQQAFSEPMPAKPNSKEKERTAPPRPPEAQL